MAKATATEPVVRRLTTSIMVGGVHGFTFAEGAHWAFADARAIPAVVLANSEPVDDPFGIAPIERFDAADFACRTAPPPPEPPPPVYLTKDDVLREMGWTEDEWQVAIRYGGFPGAQFKSGAGVPLWPSCDVTRFREAQRTLAPKGSSWLR